MEAIASQLIEDPLVGIVFELRRNRLLGLCLQIAEMERNLALTLEIASQADLRREAMLLRQFTAYAS
jgi:hypothetical protein